MMPTSVLSQRSVETGSYDIIYYLVTHNTVVISDAIILWFQNTTGLGRMWLKQMGESALRYGITVQSVYSVAILLFLLYMEW